jgi:hypothetical protein
MAAFMSRLARSVALVLLVAATAAAFHYFVYLPAVCEIDATRSLAALERVADRGDASRRGVADEAERSLKRCQCLEGTNFKIAYATGTARHYRGDQSAAIDQYQLALAVDRRPEIYIDLGLAQLNALDRSAAMESFVAAGTFAPATLARIPFDDLRNEAVRQIRARHGADWIPPTPR